MPTYPPFAATGTPSDPAHARRLDLAGGDHRAMGVQLAERLGGVLDPGGKTGLTGDRPGIARLATTLAVERGLVGDDVDCLSGDRTIDPDAVEDEAEEVALGAWVGRACRGRVFEILRT